MDIRFLLAVSLALFLSTPLVYVSGGVMGVEISPERPVQGDILTLTIEADPGEEVEVVVSFSERVSVEDGGYEYRLSGVDVPRTPNFFRVKACGVEDLHVAVKIGFWITKSAEAVDGVAVVSQGNVPKGSYDIKITGNAVEGEGEVVLDISAKTTVTMDDDGYCEYSYDTGGMPSGTFTAQVGGVKRTVMLRPSEQAPTPPGNLKPDASASFPSSVMSRETVIFNASGSSDRDGRIVSHHWEFGDGTAATGVTASHSYAEPGLYTITLTVTDDEGATASILGNIKVMNRMPVAYAGSSRTVYTNQAVDLSGSASFDPDGGITSFLWNLGDGAILKGEKIQHRYQKPGTYTLNLTVTDVHGASSSHLVKVTVINPPETPIQVLEKRLPVNSSGVLLDASEEMGIMLYMKTLGEAHILLQEFTGNPYPSPSAPSNPVGSVVDISVSNPEALSSPITVERTYKKQELDGANITMLRLFYWNGSAWHMFRETGVKTGSRLVWGRLTPHERAGTPILIAEAPSHARFRLSGLKVYPSQVSPGSSVKASVEVINLGDLAGNHTVKLKVNGSLIDTEPVQLEGGASKTLTFTLTERELGSYRVTAGEEETLFKVTETPRLLDLSIAEISIDPPTIKTGNTITIKTRITNRGEIDAKTFIVALKINELTIASKRITKLTRNNSTELTFNYTPKHPGDYKARLHIDLLDENPEIDENNNQAKTTFKAAPQRETPPLLLPLSVLSAAILILIIWKKAQ